MSAAVDNNSFERWPTTIRIRHDKVRRIDTVVFVSVHGAARSQMAEAIFNHLANPTLARAVAAGVHPAHRVDSEVVEVMREVRLDLERCAPVPLTAELVRGATWLITMGCSGECPPVPGAQCEEWPVADPRGQPRDLVRRARDAIRARVWSLIVREGWWRFGPREKKRQ